MKLHPKHLFPPSENPTVPDTLGQRLREAWCRWFEHVRYGYETGLPQATCRRCGQKLWGAIPQVPEWREPD